MPSRNYGAVLSLLAIPAVVAIACGGGDGGLSPGEATVRDSVPGVWAYKETLGDPAHGIHCTDTGLLIVSQTGLTFTATVEQTGMCDTPSGPQDNSGQTSFSGGRVGQDSIRFEYGGCRYTGRLFDVPPDSMAGSVRCASGGLPSLVLLGEWSASRPFIAEPLTVTGGVTPPIGDVSFVTGETLEFTVTGRTNLPVHWVGYRLGRPANVQDSVAGTDSVVSGVFHAPVLSSWDGAPTVTLFARDSLGRLSESAQPAVPILDAIRRPIDTTTLAATALDLVDDPARNGLYLLQRDLSQVTFFDLGTFTAGRTYPLALPALPNFSLRGDITHGGDSLAIAIAGTDSIVFLNLVTGATSSVKILPDAGFTEPVVVFNVRLTSDNKAFIYGQRSENFYIYFSLWEYDLATGVQRRVTEVAAAGSLGATSEIERSADGSHLLVLDGLNNCSSVYSAANGSFGLCRQAGHPIAAFPSATGNGDRWLLHAQLYDGTLAAIGPIVPGDPGPAALARDGSVAYLSTAYGYRVVRVSDGQELEKVRIPVGIPQRLALLQGGQRMLVWASGVGGGEYLVATDRLIVIDLR